MPRPLSAGLAPNARDRSESVRVLPYGGRGDQCTNFGSDIMAEEQTIEQLQAMVLELKASVEQLTAQNQATKDELDKVTTDRDEARKLNAKLFRSAVSPEAAAIEAQGEQPETVEQFIDSFLKPAKEALYKQFGVE